MTQQMINIHVYPRLLTPRDRLVMEPGGEPIEVSEDKLLVWIDLAPEYRFVHPTRTVLIGAEAVEVHEGQWWLEVDDQRFPAIGASTPGVVAPLKLGAAEVHVLPRVFAAGEVIEDGTEGKIGIDEPSVVIWIDRDPTGRFAHATRYVVIGAGATRVVDGDWWPTVHGRKALGLPMAVPQPWSFEAGGRGAAGEPTAVDAVLAVDVMPSKVASERASASVNAIGQVPTAGWSDARLSQRVYVAPPGDDIVDFDFTARPPAGPSADVVSQVVASHALALAGVAGVRIHGKRESVTIHVPMITDALTPGDPFHVVSADFEGDTLVVKVRYGGGCARHDFRVLWDGSIRKSDPPQLDLLLTHDAHNDPCRALLTRTLRIDMLDLPPAIVRLRDGRGYEAELRYRVPAT